MNKHFTILANALLLGLIISGCGKAADSGAALAERGQPKETPDRTVVIEANDLMKFNIVRFEVNSGETVELVLKNVGTMPKLSMGHNVVILNKGSNPQAFVQAAMSSAASDYVPAARLGEVVAQTKLLGGGETDSIRFVVPAARGDYPFVCSFPGHLQVGMRGFMQVN